MSIPLSPRAPSAVLSGRVKDKKSQGRYCLVRSNTESTVLSSPTEALECTTEDYFSTIPSVPDACMSLETCTPSPTWSPIDEQLGKPPLSPMVTLDFNFRQMGLNFDERPSNSQRRPPSPSPSKRLKTSHNYSGCSVGSHPNLVDQEDTLQEHPPPEFPFGGNGNDSPSSASTISEPHSVPVEREGAIASQSLRPALKDPIFPSARDDQAPAERVMDLRTSDEIQRASDSGADLLGMLGEPAMTGNRQQSYAEQTPIVSVEGPAAAQDVTDWLSEVTASLESALEQSLASNRYLQVLSQALPTPSTPGHVFPLIINKIRANLLTSPMTWINVIHAVPGRFTLADLPFSTPNTPGLPVGGDDYFTTKVFDSAVAAADYDSRLPLEKPHSHALAPPGHIHLSIVERYIPPASPNEVSRLFDPSGPSFLVDRLEELVSTNGCVLFIYPTKKGAETFLTDYLGPILDPLLRKTMVLSNLPTKFVAELGKSPSTDALPEWDAMRESVTALCEQLSSNNNNSIHHVHSDHESSTDSSRSYSVAYAARQCLSLERSVWSDWWCRQEKPRLERCIQDHVSRQASFRQPREAQIDSSALLKDILGAISTQPFLEPTGKIEVGVFLIQSKGVV